MKSIDSQKRKISKPKTAKFRSAKETRRAGKLIGKNLINHPI